MEMLQVDWDKVNKIFSKGTKLHKCEECGEFKVLDLLQSTIKMKMICTECGED